MKGIYKKHSVIQIGVSESCRVAVYFEFLFAAHDVGTNNNADVVIIAVVDVAFVLVALNNEERILEAISDQYWMLKIHRAK